MAKFVMGVLCYIWSLSFFVLVFMVRNRHGRCGWIDSKEKSNKIYMLWHILSSLNIMAKTFEMKRRTNISIETYREFVVYITISIWFRSSLWDTRESTSLHSKWDSLRFHNLANNSNYIGNIFPCAHHGILKLNITYWFWWYLTHFFILLLAYRT